MRKRTKTLGVYLSKEPRFHFLKMFHAVWFALVVMLAGGGVLLPTFAHATQTYTLITGLRNGSFYPIGVGLATLMHLKQSHENNVLITTQRSNGAVDNMHALLNGEADIAFVDAATAIAALTKKPPFDQYDNGPGVRALLPLWKDVGHFVIKRDFAIDGLVSDFRHLSGEAISFGAYTSASYSSSAHVLSQVGLYYANLFNIPDLDKNETLKSFGNDLISGFLLFTGDASAPVSGLMDQPGVDAMFLSVSDEQLDLVNTTEIPIWERYTIPANTYPNQPEDVQTIAQDNFLVVREDFEPDHAHYIVRTLYSNPAFLGALHMSTLSIGRENPLERSLIPLHAGASRFFENRYECDSLGCLFN